MPSVGTNQHDTSFSYLVIERFEPNGTKSTPHRIVNGVG
jgi:hypothetical protein